MASGDQISAQLAEIQRTLGALVADSKRADEDRKQANEHRARVHERIDELSADMNDRFRRTDENIVITGQIAAQARDSVGALKKVVDEEIKPQTDDFKKMRMMGSGFMLAVALVAGTLGITFADAARAFLSALRRTIMGH